MELLKIRIRGYTNIKDFSLDLSDLTALVSLNSFGKSNMLNAIDFGIDFITADMKLKDSMMCFQSAIPINHHNGLQNYFFEFEAKTTLNDQVHLIKYFYEFQWGKKGKKSAKIVSESLEIKKDEKNQKYGCLISRDDKTAFYKSSPTGRCNTKTEIQSNMLVLNKLMAFDQLYFLDIIKQLNSLVVYIDHHLDASKSYSPDFFVRKDLDDLDIERIENIPRTIFYLEREYPEKYELLKDAYLQLFPNITDFDVIEISTDNIKQKVTFSVNDNNMPFVFSNEFYDILVSDVDLMQPISFRMLSDGAKRVFLMLTFAIIADIKGLPLIAFEEPENSLHPSLMQSFLLAITQLTEKCKIVITSHSPYMLQYILSNNIYIGMPNKDHLAAFRRVSNSKVPMLLRDARQAGLSVGSYIFELLSGCEDDMEQLNEYLGGQKHE